MPSSRAKRCPPRGQTPLTWRLLTTWPVETDDDVLALIEAYSLRWLIERFHFVLKSGCRVEELQLDRESRLERALTTYTILAVRLLRLTYLARREPETAGVPELTATAWQVLRASTPILQQTRGSEPTVRVVVRAIAGLGGFIGRTGDGEPGVKTLWRGLQQLHLMALGWELHHALSSSGPVVGNG
jgi:Transposase Tn5 dimerisation domain